MSLSPRKRDEESAPFPGVPLKELPEEDATPFPGIQLKVAPVAEKKQNKAVVTADSEQLLDVHMQQAATRRSAKELLDASQELAEAGAKLVAELRAMAEAYPGLAPAQRFNDYANGLQALEDTRFQAFYQPIKDRFVEPYNSLLPLEIRDAKEHEKRVKDDLLRFEAVMRAEQRTLDVKDYHKLQQQLQDMLRDSTESERLKGQMHEFTESVLQVKLSQWTAVHDLCQEAVSAWHSDSTVKMQLLEPVWTAALELAHPEPAADTWTAWLDAHEEAAKTDAKLTAKEIKELKEKNRAADPSAVGSATIKRGHTDLPAAAVSPVSPHTSAASGDSAVPASPGAVASADGAEAPAATEMELAAARAVQPPGAEKKSGAGGLMSTLRRGKKAQLEPVVVPEVSLTAPPETEHDTLAAFMESRDPPAAEAAPAGALFEPVAPPEKKKLFGFGGRRKEPAEKKDKPPKPEKTGGKKNANKDSAATAAATAAAAATATTTAAAAAAAAASPASSAPIVASSTGGSSSDNVVSPGAAPAGSSSGVDLASHPVAASEVATKPAAPEKPLPAEPPKKKQLPPGWGCHRDDAGDKYFFNYETGESLWTMEGYSDYSDS